eukprot:CAMPEP_0118884500 /NCGR_PEP_ID=MMETSP1163-20130328/23317_1 /TAXON_ID=124430 /ORGANISM="Phaeomonas parva, Strain CCMP2877" /LENGTH=124 /DNA_ID=CAMNT_0006822295 /DNA_START=24 /DNA_END=395 /DNA_ORIENTATION=+
MRLPAALLLALTLSAAAATRVELVRTLWGVEAFGDVDKWPQLFQDLAAANYTAVETPTWVVCGVGPTFAVAHNCPEERKKAWRHALDVSGLQYVAQVHTCGYPIASGSVEDHLVSLQALLLHAK